MTGTLSGMVDTGLVIDITKRTITNADGLEQVLVLGDNNSQLLTFKMPDDFDGIDVLTKNIFITFINAAGSGDKTAVVDVKRIAPIAEGEPGHIEFGWVVPALVTEKAGYATIAIEISGVDYKWSTKATTLKIEETVDLSEGLIIPEQTWLNAYEQNLLANTAAAADSATAAATSESHAKVSENNAKEAEENVGGWYDELLPALYTYSGAEVILARWGESNLQTKIGKIDLQIAEQPVNVKSFGALGNGIHDDTQAFLDAVATGKRVIVPATNSFYVISDTINGCVNSITGENYPKIKMVPPANQYPVLFEYANVHAGPIEFRGLHLMGNWDRAGTITEQQHAIAIRKCDNITISWNIFEDMYGDCIYIASSYAAIPVTVANYCKNVLMENNVMRNFRRNAVSFISCVGATIRKNDILKINSYTAIIDMEPNEAYEYVQKIDILDNKITCTSVDTYNSKCIAIWHPLNAGVPVDVFRDIKINGNEFHYTQPVDCAYFRFFQSGVASPTVVNLGNVEINDNKFYIANAKNSLIAIQNTAMDYLTIKGNYVETTGTNNYKLFDGYGIEKLISICENTLKCTGAGSVNLGQIGGCPEIEIMYNRVENAINNYLEFVKILGDVGYLVNLLRVVGNTLNNWGGGIDFSDTWGAFIVEKLIVEGNRFDCSSYNIQTAAGINIHEVIENSNTFAIKTNLFEIQPGKLFGGNYEVVTLTMDGDLTVGAGVSTILQFAYADAKVGDLWLGSPAKQISYRVVYSAPATIWSAGIIVINFHNPTNTDVIIEAMDWRFIRLPI